MFVIEFLQNFKFYVGKIISWPQTLIPWRDDLIEIGSPFYAFYTTLLPLSIYIVLV